MKFDTSRTSTMASGLHAWLKSVTGSRSTVQPQGGLELNSAMPKKSFCCRFQYEGSAHKRHFQTALTVQDGDCIDNLVRRNGRTILVVKECAQPMGEETFVNQLPRTPVAGNIDTGHRESVLETAAPSGPGMNKTAALPTVAATTCRSQWRRDAKDLGSSTTL